jgi:hypothetical protein
MRLICFALFLSAVIPVASVRAHEAPVNTCATDMTVSCVLDIHLREFELMRADPVVIDRTIVKLLGTNTDGQMMTLDISLEDGSMIDSQLFGVRLDVPAYATALMSPDGKTLAVQLPNDADEATLHFFDAGANPLGVVSAQSPGGWGHEFSPAAMLGLLAGQNLLTLDATALRGTFYRFELSASVIDGTFEVRELRPANGADDTMNAYFERRFANQMPGPGYDHEHYRGPLAAVTTEAADGSPSRVLVRSDEGGEVAFDQRLGRQRMGYHYQDARLSPDGTRLAVIRDSSYASADPPVQLMVFDVATAFPVFLAPVPEGPLHRQLVWLPDNRIAVFEMTDDGGTNGFVFDLPAVE